MESTYFRRGFGLKAEIEGQLTADYHSTVVEALRARDYRLEVGRLSFRLAREFGFCYGVDRAVDYAYETRRKFPDRRLYLVGEIIHNPHVNQKLRDMGVRFLARGDGGGFDFSTIGSQDVVILPAFGVTMGDFERLRALGCVLVDTTCGSVLNVWKRVESYARDGYTAVIHGKHYHEETKATASQVMKYPGGRYLVVLNMDEARAVCDFIEGGGGGLAGVRLRAGPAAGGDREPDDDALGRVARDRGGDPPQRGAPLRRGGGARPLPLVRHDLLGDAGAAGRGAGAHPRPARRHGGRGRVQLQQHLPSRRTGAVRGRAHLPHRGCPRRGPGGGDDPPPADRHPA
jgi:hypothetical protein